MKKANPFYCIIFIFFMSIISLNSYSIPPNDQEDIDLSVTAFILKSFPIIPGSNISSMCKRTVTEFLGILKHATEHLNERFYENINISLAMENLYRCFLLTIGVYDKNDGADYKVFKATTAKLASDVIVRIIKTNIRYTISHEVEVSEETMVKAVLQTIKYVDELSEDEIDRLEFDQFKFPLTYDEMREIVREALPELDIARRKQFEHQLVIGFMNIVMTDREIAHTVREFLDDDEIVKIAKNQLPKVREAGAERLRYQD
ncbi:MAG: hypothetical protein PUP46_01290 [Endozoicomonas sp. (ex Botrylloides leachii)]|nr:hypothetical protein [Endozoicomonas sp. (ex Botrylloides leachii)]